MTVYQAQVLRMPIHFNPHEIKDEVLRDAAIEQVCLAWAVYGKK